MPTRTILVVEDDLNDEHLTLRALRQSGVSCSVLVAHNAQEALHFLHRTGPFDGRTTPNPIAIFVDSSLPGYGGADLVKEIREIPELWSVPVIILSGNSDGNVVERCCRAGANSFLEKPVDVSEYARQISVAAHYWLSLNVAPSSLRGFASAM